MSRDPHELASRSHRVLQVHPSRLCNLACTHCYTASGPRERETLDGGRLATLVTDAAALGYTYLAVSGGEPLLFPGLAELADRGREAGMTVVATTNGTLPLTARRVDVLRRFDVLAVSVDGGREAHDRVRGRAAFRRTDRTLAGAVSAGLDWAAVFTLTRSNLDQLPGVVEYAAGHGARFVQVHALALSGRALDGMAGAPPDSVELAAAMALAGLLTEQYSVPVRVDAALAAALPEVVGSDAGFSAHVPILTVLPDGRLQPLHHDIAAPYGVGSLHTGRLAGLAERWLAERGPAYRALLRRSRALLRQPDGPLVVDWPMWVADQSRTGSEPPVLGRPDDERFVTSPLPDSSPPGIPC